MARFISICSLVFVLVGGALPLSAQNATPKITLVQPGAESLYADLDYVMGLTNDVEQKQLKVVKEYLDVFLVGLDPQKPLRVDVVLTGDVRRYISAFPLANIANFRNNNLAALGINTRPRGQDFWQCAGAFVGFMRKLDDYVVFAEQREEIPRGMPNPIAGAKALLDLKYDLAGELSNPPEGQDTRRKHVQKERGEIIGALKQTKEETPEDFALRKKFFEMQFDEMERFYAESKHALLGWNLDTTQTAKAGKFDLQLAAIPDTSLAATFKELGAKPSRFTGVKKHDKSILSFRLTHPLDQLRISNFSSLFEMSASVAKKNIDADKELKPEQQDAARKIADQIAGLFVATAKSGLADGFLEAHGNASGKYTLVGAFQAVNAPSVLDTLKLLPQARPDQKLEFDIATEGDVKIHKAVITGKQYEIYKDFFGTNEAFVGLSKDIVWFAAGENALNDLKSAIQQAGTTSAPPKDGVFLDFFGQAGPWIELREKRNPQLGDVKLRQKAIEAFKAGEDTFTMQLKKDKDQIVGGLVAQPGILRFAGKVIADFSKENLDGGGNKKDDNKTATKKAAKTN